MQDDLVLQRQVVFPTWLLWLHARCSQMGSQAETGTLATPIEDSVVALEHGLAEDEDVRAQGLRPAHGQQLRRAQKLLLQRALCHVSLCLGVLLRFVRARVLVGLLSRRVSEAGVGRHRDVAVGQDVRRQGQQAHVVLRVQREVDTLELQDHDWRLDHAAVGGIAGGRREHRVQQGAAGAWDAEVRGAAVQDAEATATVADVQPLTADGHREDLNLPIAEFRLGHGHPGEWPRKAGRVVAAESDLALLPVVAFCQEDAKLGQPNPAASGEEVEEAEVLVQCQAVEPQAENPVKVEELKGSLRHLDGHHDVRLHAGPAWQRAASLFRGLRSGAQADLLACKLAGDQARAKADGHLVCSMASGHWQAVQVQGLGHL
mmetsp:Transcript_45494/g.141005  ORF Transcript_45494/g.141005 Transcript_45494/m.141005 type:complete len:374 (-) Transcript_45494:413-1534(-)